MMEFNVENGKRQYNCIYLKYVCLTLKLCVNFLYRLFIVNIITILSLYVDMSLFLISDYKHNMFIMSKSKN